MQVDALAAAGHSTLVVTTDQHYEKVTARPDERVLDPAIKDPRTLRPLARVTAEARRFAPDVVGSRVDGLGVIARLRRCHGPLPAVLITADRSPAVRALAAEADVRVLMKPLKPAALRSLLSQWHLLRSDAD